MTPKRVLIITYYWPPSGGSGVQRWVKFVKYLRDFGWEPVIYTPANPEYPALDESLEGDLPENLQVIKRPITEPYNIYKKLVGMKKEDKLGSGLMKKEGSSGLMHRFSVWVRGNFFIPDARKWWIKPSVRFLTEHLRANQYDALVSTGPPHSMHMIGLGAKQNTGIPWLADFRDPWTNIDFFEELRLSENARKKHERLEQLVLDHADEITVVSPTMKKEYSLMTDTPVTVITNGFDAGDFPVSDESPPEDTFLLTHIGMMTATRNPEILWQVLSEIRNDHVKISNVFRLQLIGKVDELIQNKIKEYKLEEMVLIRDYIPHDEIIKEQQRSHALLLIINESPNAELLLPGKIFEYLASGRPVICTTPVDGDASKVIKETGAGEVINTYDKEHLRDHILDLIHRFQKGDLRKNTMDEATMKFSRKHLTERLAERLESIIS